jgi:hypothetical protein
MCTTRSKVVTSCLAVALVVATIQSYAAPTPDPALARLTGTVYADDVKTPLAGATVVVTDANGAKFASQPTEADGAFTIAAVTPGRSALALETKQGTFAVATPVTLAPGEARGVRLALKAGGGSKGAKGTGTAGGAAMPAGAIAAMTAVIVGFVAAGAVAADRLNNSTSPSPAQPTEK